MGSYPVIVPPRETVALYVGFEFHDEIRSVFEEPAELRVHYRSGEKDEIAEARLVGGGSQ